MANVIYWQPRAMQVLYIKKEWLESNGIRIQEVTRQIFNLIVLLWIKQVQDIRIQGTTD